MQNEAGPATAAHTIVPTNIPLITNVGHIALKKKLSNNLIPHVHPDAIQPAVIWISPFPHLRSPGLSCNNLGLEGTKAVIPALGQLTQL